MNNKKIEIFNSIYNSKVDENENYDNGTTKGSYDQAGKRR